MIFLRINELQFVFPKSIFYHFLAIFFFWNTDWSSWWWWWIFPSIKLMRIVENGCHFLWALISSGRIKLWIDSSWIETLIIDRLFNDSHVFIGRWFPWRRSIADWFIFLFLQFPLLSDSIAFHWKWIENGLKMDWKWIENGLKMDWKRIGNAQFLGAHQDADWIDSNWLNNGPLDVVQLALCIAMQCPGPWRWRCSFQLIFHFPFFIFINSICGVNQSIKIIHHFNIFPSVDKNELFCFCFCNELEMNHFNIWFCKSIRINYFNFL